MDKGPTSVSIQPFQGQDRGWLDQVCSLPSSSVQNPMLQGKVAEHSALHGRECSIQQRLSIRAGNCSQFLAAQLGLGLSGCE